MVDWIRLAAMPLLLVAIIVRRSERKIVKALNSAQSLTVETSIELPRLNRLGRWQLGRLQAAGAVVTSGAGLYYFVPTGYASFRAARRRRATFVVPIFLLLAFASWYFSR